MTAGMRAAIVLDLDGTLVDSRADLAASANAGRAAIGLPPLAVDEVGRHVGDGAAKLIERVTPDADAPARAAALAAFRAHYRGQCTVATAPYPGVVEALFALIGMGWRLGVSTNKPLEYTRAILDRCGLSRFLGHVHGGDTLRKPDPAAVWAVLKAVGAEPSRSWMAGDHHTDLVAGEAAGCRTCFCAWGFGRRNGRPADAVAERPQDLPRWIGPPGP